MTTESLARKDARSMSRRYPGGWRVYRTINGNYWCLQTAEGLENAYGALVLIAEYQGGNETPRSENTAKDGLL